MTQGVCKLSVVPMRAEPESKSELVSQLLFGETYEVIDQQNEWVKINTHNENYSAWINLLQHSPWDGNSENQFVIHSFPFVEAINQVDNSSVFLLPGSIVHRFDYRESESAFVLNNVVYRLRIHDSDIKNLPVSEMCVYANRFLNMPYLWGGKTMWGIDCSGFTQLMYKLAGVQLPRDAWQQAEEGENVAFVNETKPGDLAFFENADGKITHVGMILDTGEIIHASGKVRRDVLDSYGIFHEKQGQHTHKLRVIKRIII